MVRLACMVTLVGAAGLVAGCASVSRGLGTVTANKYAEARSGTLWIVAPPQLEPVSGDRTVYISYRNISDAQDIDLLQIMRNSARQQGWTIVNDPGKAQFRLRASLRFFGEVEPESGGAQAASGLGSIAGAAAVGVGVGVGMGALTNSNLGGVAAGGLAAALVAQGLSNASRPREYAAIVDFVLEEYSAQPVTFTLSTGSASGSYDAAGAAGGRMVSGGSQTQGNSAGASMAQTSHYFPHGVRLSAWANQMAMKETEALPLITGRIERVVTQLLPM